MLSQTHVSPDRIKEMLGELINEKRYYDDINNHELRDLLMIWQSSMDISKDFFNELISFGDRNIVSFENGNGKKINDNKVCVKCFKAHLGIKAREFGLSERTIQFLSKPFKCETGHNEYYKDDEKIIRIY